MLVAAESSYSLSSYGLSLQCELLQSGGCFLKLLKSLQCIKTACKQIIIPLSRWETSKSAERLQHQPACISPSQNEAAR